MKYMVAFTGFHYVEADSEEEAMERWMMTTPSIPSIPTRTPSRWTSSL